MRRMVIGSLLLSLAAAPAGAKEKVSFQNASVVKDAPTVTLDPTRAYIMVRSDAAIPLLLMRDQGEEDRPVYDRLRTEALVEAREKHVRKVIAYDRAVAAAAKTPKFERKPRIPEKPVEPTESNFEFTPFGLLTAVNVGPLNRFAKQDGGASTYLQAVTPGTYRLYGAIAVPAGAAPVGACFCMGSVRFEAKAGEIVDLGLIATKPSATASEAGTVATGFRILPASSEMAVDPRLSGAKVVPARYRPAGKLPNYYGVMIDRIPEMPGVLRYDRDRIVDLTAGG